MDIRSMTGFAKTTMETEFGTFTIEMFGLNHRYRDIHINLPRVLSACEDALRKKISDAVPRGKVRVVISLNAQASRQLTDYQVNMEYASAYIKALNEIQQTFNLPGELSLDAFLNNRDILVTEQTDFDENAAFSVLENLIDQTLDKLYIEQEKEGKQLVEDITSRIALIDKTVTQIKDETPQSVSAYRDKLLERIKELQLEGAVEEDRIAKEVAMYADKIDISEELVRLKSHIKHFMQTIEKGGVVGKKLDFVAQELFREINTIAAKCNNVSISHKSITVRSELEKIREQVQNIQ